MILVDFDMPKNCRECPIEGCIYHAENDTRHDLCPIVREVVLCKDCKYFEYNHPYMIHGVPVLGHLVCNRWGDGCRTDENGFCFMGERKNE